MCVCVFWCGVASSDVGVWCVSTVVLRPLFFLLDLVDTFHSLFIFDWSNGCAAPDLIGRTVPPLLTRFFWCV